MPVRLTGPLVGMHFRPPAKDVVNLLPAGCPLILQRQPDNQYDINAVQVLLPGFSADGQHAHIFMQFKNDALDDEELLGRLQDPLFVGFVANSEKTGGKKADLIAREMDGLGLLRVSAKLAFNPKGDATIETDCEPVIEEPCQSELDHVDEPDSHPTDAPDDGPTGGYTDQHLPRD